MQLALTVSDVRAVQAVALAASSDSSRPILTGLFVTPASNAMGNGAEHPYTVQATDSYRLAWHGLSGGEVEGPASDLGPVLIPATPLVAALKSLKVGARVPRGTTVALLTVEVGDELTPQRPGSWRVEGFGPCAGVVVGGELPCLGKYPDTRQLIPASYPNEVSQGAKGLTALNPLYLATVGDAAKVLKVEHTTSPVQVFVSDATRPVRFTIVHPGGQFSYLLMPVRVN